MRDEFDSVNEDRTRSGEGENLGRGRTYSTRPCAIWDDDRYLDLSPQAQHLWGVLADHPNITHCGVVDWRPARLTPKARTWTVEAIEIAALELEETGWVLFSLGTEEAIVRDHIRFDEILRNPKNSIAMIKAYGAIASRELRAAVVSELRACKTLFPNHSAWSSPISADRLAELVARTALDSVDYRPAYADADAMPEAYRTGSPILAGVTSPMRSYSRSPMHSGMESPIRNGTGSRITTTSASGTRRGIESGIKTATGSGSGSGSGSEMSRGPASASGSGMAEGSIPTITHQPSTIAAGYVPDEPSLARASTAALGVPPRPPQRCPEHLEFVSATGCLPCHEQRVAAKAWDKSHPAEALAFGAARRLAITECELCDDEGWRTIPPQLSDEDLDITCTHIPWPEEKWVDFYTRKKSKK